MPKISLHVEADSAEEFHALLASFQAKQPEKYELTFEEVQRRHERLAEARREKAIEEVDAIEIPAEPVEEKKARKPRGPNKPKMAPVTEDAPEEVEHVGTVAQPTVSPETVERGNGEVLTRMDLGDTIAGYVRKYGINFAQTDVSKMLQDMFGADVRKKSDVPEDQPSLRKAITTITQATIDNPYNRKVDVNG